MNTIHSRGKEVASRGVVRAGRARVARGRPAAAFGQEAAPANAPPPGLPRRRARLEVQLRRGRRWRSASRNSLYTNPKPEEPSGDLSDNWFEGSIKPALSAEYTTCAAPSQFYGKLSAVGERTYGAAPTLVGDDASSFGVEDLYVGWRSGDSLGARRERARLHGRPRAVQARPRHAAVGRRRGRRLARRLLDQRAQGVRVRRDRALQARQPHGRGVLSRQGRTARGELATASSGARTTSTRSARTRRSARPT